MRGGGTSRVPSAPSSETMTGILCLERVRRSLIVPAALSLVVPAMAGAQDDWMHAAPATTPPGRYDAGMAFDSARNRTVLFGGVDVNFNGLNDTWEWDGSTWTQLSPATSPPARSASA